MAVMTGFSISGTGLPLIWRKGLAITLIKWGDAVQPGAEKGGRNVEYNLMVAREVLEQEKCR